MPSGGAADGAAGETASGAVAVAAGKGEADGEVRDEENSEGEAGGEAFSMMKVNVDEGEKLLFLTSDFFLEKVSSCQTSYS